MAGQQQAFSCTAAQTHIICVAPTAPSAGACKVHHRLQPAQPCAACCIACPKAMLQMRQASCLLDWLCHFLRTPKQPP